MNDPERADTTPSPPPEGDSKTSGGIVRRRRKLAPLSAWERSDLATAASLVLWLLPAWILPEAFWAPLWRAKMRLSALTGARETKRTAKTVLAALGDRDGPQCEVIMLHLKA